MSDKHIIDEILAECDDWDKYRSLKGDWDEYPTWKKFRHSSLIELKNLQASLCLATTQVTTCKRKICT